VRRESIINPSPLSVRGWGGSSAEFVVWSKYNHSDCILSARASVVLSRNSEYARTDLSEDVYSKSDLLTFTDFLESQTNIRRHYRAF
jgi:hypothetical protein